MSAYKYPTHLPHMCDLEMLFFFLFFLSFFDISKKIKLLPPTFDKKERKKNKQQVQHENSPARKNLEKI
jgi:hypothetical protein